MTAVAIFRRLGLAVRRLPPCPLASFWHTCPISQTVLRSGHEVQLLCGCSPLVNNGPKLKGQKEDSVIHSKNQMGYRVCSPSASLTFPFVNLVEVVSAVQTQLSYLTEHRSAESATSPRTRKGLLLIITNHANSRLCLCPPKGAITRHFAYFSAFTPTDASQVLLPLEGCPASLIAYNYEPVIEFLSVENAQQ